MRELVHPFIIMSVYQSGPSVEQNSIAHNQFCEDLTRVHRKFLSVVGSYKGKLEQSILIPMQHKEAWRDWLSIAWRFGQESILVRHSDRSCYLVFLSSEAEVYLGQWSEVSSSMAQRQDAWTRIQGRYFMAV